MTSSIFLAKNLAILFLAIQSIDPYLNDKLLKESDFLTMESLFELRNTKVASYTSSSESYKLATLVILTQWLLTIISQTYLQRAIKNILEDFSYHGQSSKKAHGYIKRFTFNYYRTFKPYLIGYQQYHNYQQITNVSLTNLFLLHRASEDNGSYIIILYLLGNSADIE